METLQTKERDPRMKMRVKIEVEKLLYAPVAEAFDARIKNIVNRNTLMCGYRDNSLIYKGQTYLYDPAGTAPYSNKLHPSLKPEMEEYLADFVHINLYEKPLTMGYVISVMNLVIYAGDFLVLFPDCLHSCVKNIVSNELQLANRSFTQRGAESVLEQNAKGIQLIKERLTKNLFL